MGLGSNFILPVLSPLRALRVAEPATFSYVFNPLAIVVVLFAAGGMRVLKLRSRFQVLLAFAFVQAAMLGLFNLAGGGSVRAFLSHLFQLASAFVMFGVGRTVGHMVHEETYRRIAMLSIVGFVIGTAVTVAYLATGDIPRFYGPSYAALLPLSLWTGQRSFLLVVMTVAGLIVANKRGMILAGAAVVLSSVAFRWHRRSRDRAQRRVLAASGALAAMSVLLGLLLLLGGSWTVLSGPIEAAKLSLGRMGDAIEVIGGSGDADRASAGRVSEIERALETFHFYTPFTGNGAGWQAAPDDQGRAVQNIHLTPLSLVATFGAPLAVGIYLISARLVWQAIRSSRSGLSRPEKTFAALYVVGAIVHSLFAYSLFIDLFFFFLLGRLACQEPVALDVDVA